MDIRFDEIDLLNQLKCIWCTNLGLKDTRDSILIIIIACNFHQIFCSNVQWIVEMCQIINNNWIITGTYYIVPKTWIEFPDDPLSSLLHYRLNCNSLWAFLSFIATNQWTSLSGRTGPELDWNWSPSGRSQGLNFMVRSVDPNSLLGCMQANKYTRDTDRVREGCGMRREKEVTISWFVNQVEDYEFHLFSRHLTCFFIFISSHLK